MKKLLIALAAFSPAVAFAQIGTSPVTNADQLATKLQSIGNVIIEILISLAVIWVVISVVMYLISSGEGKSGWRSNVVWGIVGLAIILSIWGIVYLLRNTFNTGTNAVNQQDVPRVLPISGQPVYQ